MIGGSEDNNLPNNNIKGVAGLTPNFNNNNSNNKDSYSKEDPHNKAYQYLESLEQKVF